MKEYGDFISEEDRMMIATLRDFVKAEILPFRQKMDEDYERKDVHRVLHGLAALGMHKRGLPESMGGIRTSAVSLSVGYEEVSRGDCGIAMTLSVPPWVFGPAMRSHNDRVLSDLCPPYCGDTFVEACQAMTEPEGGCNIESAEYRGKAIHTIARRDGDQWVINGGKQFPSGASAAEVYLVTCTTDPSLAEDGIALIYVPADTPGLSFSKPEDKMGMRFTDVNASIYLDEVRVPVEYRAATEPGKDFQSFRNFLAWGRLSSAAFAVGAAQAALDVALEFTGRRYYGGKQVRQHTLQAAMLADMMIGIESARFYYLTVASMFDNRKVYGPPYSDEQIARASGAKVYACDVAVKVCNMAMELTGSYGYMRDYHIEKYLRDCKIIQLWEGGAQLGRIDVARSRYPMVPYV
ncbi:MAG: acyl-CoA dehydrogenase family protein [Dehalococcoidia bacterium]|nr:acyl-CoA dehydrogenase family protein [Dehalococcoidia bacterium]